MAKKEKKKLPPEPMERFEHRMRCKHYGYYGQCYKHSGYCGIGGGVAHITMACDGSCRRMKIWDTQHGLKGINFKIING